MLGWMKHKLESRLPGEISVTSDKQMIPPEWQKAEFQEYIYFCFIDYTKAFVWITTNCGKFLKRWKYQTNLPASWETCMCVKKQQLEPDMEQPIGSKLWKAYNKAVYCHPAYLTSMQSI